MKAEAGDQQVQEGEKGWTLDEMWENEKDEMGKNVRHSEANFKTLTIYDTNPLARKSGGLQTHRRHLHQSGVDKIHKRSNPRASPRGRKENRGRTPKG